MEQKARYLTSAPIGAWKVNFLPFEEIMTVRPPDMTDGQEGSLKSCTSNKMNKHICLHHSYNA